MDNFIGKNLIYVVKVFYFFVIIKYSYFGFEIEVLNN